MKPRKHKGGIPLFHFSDDLEEARRIIAAEKERLEAIEAKKWDRRMKAALKKRVEQEQRQAAA